MRKLTDRIQMVQASVRLYKFQVFLGANSFALLIKRESVEDIIRWATRFKTNASHNVFPHFPKCSGYEPKFIEGQR